VIRNGNLKLGGKTLTGSALTIVFSGTNGTWSHVIEDQGPLGKGTLNITAPTSGPWKGVALYQDPTLTQGVNFTVSGSQHNLTVSGLFYFPNAEVILSGAVNKDASSPPNLLDLPSKQRGRLVS
jgi:hypothetical protein